MIVLKIDIIYSSYVTKQIHCTVVDVSGELSIQFKCARRCICMGVCIVQGGNPIADCLTWLFNSKLLVKGNPRGIQYFTR